MIVAVIDSNAVDPLVDDEQIRDAVSRASAGGRPRLMSTHVTADELAATEDATRREALLAALSDFTELVPTGAFVLGTSRLGMARLSDDVEGFEKQRGGRMKHTNDALIAVTARYEDAVLVTHDRAMRHRAEAAGVVVYGLRELVDNVAEET
jgi:predicted nucleic acid-binding protein